MRVVRVLAGMLLLAAGVPALFVAAGLGLLTGHAEPDGAFSARFETVQTAGHAVVVDDLDKLLRAEAPFVRAGRAELRLQARTPDGPAFLGLAPTAEVERWLAEVPHAAVRRVALARGPLPVRLAPAGPSRASSAAPVRPATAPFWVRDGVGAVEWNPADLQDRRLSLVVMRPDGRADLTLDLRAEWEAGWIAPVTWGTLTAGLLLVMVAGLLLLRPVGLREVVWVVEPDQVPVLAGRLGVTSLSGLGAQPTGPRPGVERQLVAVGAASRPALGPVPARRPATLADLPAPQRPAPAGGAVAAGGSAPAAPAGAAGGGAARGGESIALTLAWPPLSAAEQSDRLRPAVPPDGRRR
ncbi:hypothetical protein GA0070616_3831 [Micromonospora nigra]|uniref:Uncharacterized protein n=1 Tax=Micromonospora nigra TaxID=145857 RepID=A0A1C6SIA9_9ACTN|nr:hypothetical protein GA0070616_3831 [Micromonospora nigra]